MTQLHRDILPLGQRKRILQMQDVDKSFNGTVAALRKMSLTVNEGDFISLLGPSGCGKSTVLRLIAGLMRPTAGRITWEGGQGADDLGVVFQEPTLMPWTTVEQNVYLPFRLRGQSFTSARDRIAEVLHLVGLDRFARSYPRELSGGMKMRVSIARALVLRPPLLLMDEPFAALDEITRFKLNNDLLNLKAELGTTVVFVTHSVYESVYLSTRIAVMAARPGRIIATIDVDEPLPRDEEFRHGALYAERCRAASKALLGAMGEEDLL